MNAVLTISAAHTDPQSQVSHDDFSFTVLFQCDIHNTEKL